MKYRSKSDMVGLILEAANGGATKTKIMYSAFLSFEQLKQYLAYLLERDLIEHEEITQKFRTTEKGMRVLKLQNQINEEFTPVMPESRHERRKNSNWSIR
jgi:predicted transcriptional regulator